MIFSSLEFLFLFFPLCTLFYFCMPKKARNYVLLIFSLIFYALGEPLYVFLMIATIFSNYFFGSMIERERRKKRSGKAMLISALVFDLSLLAFFKYFSPVLHMLADIGIVLPKNLQNIPLPIGISFYIFQAISYVVDIYRGEISTPRDPLIPATYISLFPQLIAGPIVKYKDVEESMRERSTPVSLAADGIRHFTVGLSKKVLLANTAGELWKNFALSFNGETDLLAAWLGVISFSFQIYFDFSGYSDMAIGLGKIFGFSFPQNFNYPYTAKSVRDFWHRWHITLSSFFRDYVYIPLGGSRCKRSRTYLNLLTVWLLTGLWHGAGLNFILWGLYYFLLLSVERSHIGKLLDEAPSPLKHFFSLIAIAVGWVIFAADGSTGGFDLQNAAKLLSTMFGFGSSTLFSSDSLYFLKRDALILSVMSLAATQLPKKAFDKLSISYPTLLCAFSNILTVIGILLCTAYLVNSGYNPFLYFKF